MSARSDRGALAILLHTHMPYVEGFGTWPFGEEWLWEAIATSYLPLLELLDGGAALTLSLTPVLCDQLQAPGVMDRCARFLGELRRTTHELDARALRGAGHELMAREIERSFGDYERALGIVRSPGWDLLGALAPHAQWTSAATHAVLPMLASDACVAAQVHSGIASHRARFGDRWRGGFWLPECGHAPHLEPILAGAGVRASCVELTSTLGPGAPEHLCPIGTDSGIVLVPIDRQTMSLAWSEQGYPSHGDYRDYHHHSVHHHNPWANDGGVYDHDRALARAREHGRDFVSRVRQRLSRDGAGLPGGGLLVCALDTELLGHWWYEGIRWLEAVVQECSRQQVELVRLDDALARIRPTSATAGARGNAPPAVLPQSSWGENGDLSTWSGPAVAQMSFAARRAELAMLAGRSPVSTPALRELMALQASDWAFMVSRGLAVPYAQERFEGHRRALERALNEQAGGVQQGIRNLAVHADAAVLLAPWR